jgi:predicted DNA repair protein MutK
LNYRAFWVSPPYNFAKEHPKMPSGLAALLDDIATIAKVAAASVDDVAAAAGKAGSKAAGVVIDDTAVTPQYVTGFTPDRELPIIWRIAKGSFFNKLVIILPVALLLSLFLPWAITPILMLGGAYLCFEGAEKVWEKIAPHAEENLLEELAELTSSDHEAAMVKGAVRTDFILSAEIMAIALNEVKSLAANSIWLEAGTLAAVAIMVTIGVYGVVGLIVKMDDIGLKLAGRENGASQAMGRGLVKGMPKLLSALSNIGTAAMLWVGGQIIVHGFGIHPAEFLGLYDGALAWVADAAMSGVVGLAIGAVIVVVHHKVAPRKAH